MPLFSKDAKLIRTKFNTSFTALRPTVPIVFDNDLPIEPTTKQPFVRMVVNGIDSTLAGLGNPRLFRNLGMIEVQIFTPLHSGDGLAREIADDVATVFKPGAYTTDDAGGQVVLHTTRITNPRVTEKAFYQVNASTPYHADHYEQP